MGQCCAKQSGSRAPEVEYSEDDIRRKFDNMPRLSNEEKIVLKSSWKVIRRKVNAVGAHTFLELFQAYPDSKDVFRKFQGHDLGLLVQSEIIVQHGQRVMNIIDRVMSFIDNKEKVWDLLIANGRDHFNYGALPMYFELMGPHFVIAARSTIGREWYEALEYHWLALFEVVSYCMNFGWNLQRADEQHRARTLSTGTGALARAGVAGMR